MTAAHKFMWSAANVASLTKLVSEGHSCAQIAIKLKITRNQALSKISRLGLQLKGSTGEAGLRRRAGERRAAKKPPTGLTVSQAQTQRFEDEKLARLKTEPVLLQAVELKTAELPESKPCDIHGLKSGICKWPLTGGDPWMFCGGQAPDGPYCTGHAAAAYVKPTKTANQMARSLRKFAA